MTRHSERWILLGILLGAAMLRAWNMSAGVPFAVGIDEPVVVDRALRILQTGSWNPHGFDYPSLVIYVQAWVTTACFLVGALLGRWTSLPELDIDAVYLTGRSVAALIGTGTVWLTYLIGKELRSRALGLVAAAQLAVLPMHVRESHFILTDVPTTALVVLALFLALRAARQRTVWSYAWMGCAVGLSAAAKYNGGFVAVVGAIVWLFFEWSAPDRGRKALAASAAAAAAFLVAVPFAVLDLPTFLNGIGAQAARFSGPLASDPPWHSYLLYLSLDWRFWVPLAGLGFVMVLWRRQSLREWAIPVGFIITYFYVLSSHSVVFGRYTLPILPVICLLTAVPVIELAHAVQWRYPAFAPTFVVLCTIVLTAAFAAESIRWLGEFRRPDTRLLAARWMMASLPKGTKLVVENSGPTNLAYAGFDVVERPNRFDEGSVDAYLRDGIEYVVIAPWSERALPAYRHFLQTSQVMLEVEPAVDRWGPFVRVVRIGHGDRAARSEDGDPRSGRVEHRANH